MKNQKSQSGITLIALVVTIVVLLILAGVTIVYVLSDNSIFKAATDAVTETDKATILEYAGNIQRDLSIDYYVPSTDGTSKVKTIAEYIAKDFPSGYTVKNEGDTAVKINGDVVTGTMTVTKGGYVYTVTYDAKGVPVVGDPVKATK